MESNTKKYAKFEYLRQLISICVILGFIFGVGKALLFINSNRYLELGMYNTAFSNFQSIVNYFFLTLPFAFIIVSVAILFFIYLALITLLKDKTKGQKHTYYIAAIISLVGLFLISGYQLNKLPWYPPFFSKGGFFYNIIVTLSFILVGFIILKKSPKVLSHIVPRIFHFRIALIAVFLLLILNGVFYYHELQMDRNGPNVLFITVDTLRADHLGCYGYVRDTSPNIDKLANEGILFSNAVVQWPKTAPSFASMLTGTYGYHNGVMRSTPQKIDIYFVLLPEILKNANYNTVGVVTNGTLDAVYNFNQGIDTHIETWHEYGSTDAEYVTEYALSWLKKNANKGKFFMWLHYIDPHGRYEPPEPYNEIYVGDKYYDGSRKTKLNSGISEDIGGIPENVHLGKHTEVDYYIAQYDAEIRYMDEHIGKVLDEVKAMGLSDNTIIIFTADHGESLGEHNYYFAHGRLPYNDNVEVPLIIMNPGLKSEIKVIDQPVELINILPTVLDILDIPINKEAQGKSLVPLMLGNSDSIPKYVFTEAGFQMNYQRVIRTKKWKLIYVPDEKDQRIMQGMPFELYDIENDPKELNNLVNVETKIASELQKELFKWMESAKGVNGLPSPGTVVIDKKTEENLKSLGYIE